jgi:hypothetical protein
MKQSSVNLINQIDDKDTAPIEKVYLFLTVNVRTKKKEEEILQSVSDAGQRPVGGIEKHVRTHIVLRSDPFPFQYSPKCFCNVQMRGIRRQEEDEEASLFPYRPEFFYPPVTMHRCLFPGRLCLAHTLPVLLDVNKIIRK